MFIISRSKQKTLSGASKCFLFTSTNKCSGGGPLEDVTVKQFSDFSSPSMWSAISSFVILIRFGEVIVPYLYICYIFLFIIYSIFIYIYSLFSLFCGYE